MWIQASFAAYLISMACGALYVSTYECTSIQFEPFWNLDDPEEAEIYKSLNWHTGMEVEDTSKLGVPEPIIVNMTADSNPAFRVVDDEEMARVCVLFAALCNWCALFGVYTSERQLCGSMPAGVYLRQWEYQ